MNAVTTQPQTTALATYGRVTNVAEFISTLGNDIAKSGMFGCQSLEQGRVLATECVSRGLPPMSMALKFDIIHGKLSMKSQAMLAELREKAGWKHRCIEKSPDRVAIELTTPDGRKIEESLSWEELKQEAVPYEGKEQAIVDQLAKGETPKLKAKYATPRSRANMMWNRLVSDTVRTHAPEIVCGMYTPEEIEDFTGKALPEAAEDNGQVVEGEYEVIDANQDVAPEPEDGNKGADTESVIHAAAPDEPCTDEQRTQIQDLFVELKVTYESQQNILKKRNASVLRNLTVAQAEELITKLDGLRKQTAPEEREEPDTRISAANEDPCSDSQVEAIKSAMRQAAQAGIPDIGTRVIDLLRRNGMEKLKELSFTEAEALQKVIERKSVEAFVDMSLSGYRKAEEISTEAAASGK